MQCARNMLQYFIDAGLVAQSSVHGLLYLQESMNRAQILIKYSARETQENPGKVQTKTKNAKTTKTIYKITLKNPHYNLTIFTTDKYIHVRFYMYMLTYASECNMRFIFRVILFSSLFSRVRSTSGNNRK